MTELEEFAFELKNSANKFFREEKAKDFTTMIDMVMVSNNENLERLINKMFHTELENMARDSYYKGYHQGYDNGYNDKGFDCYCGNDIDLIEENFEDFMNDKDSNGGNKND